MQQWSIVNSRDAPKFEAPEARVVPADNNLAHGAANSWNAMDRSIG